MTSLANLHRYTRHPTSHAGVIYELYFFLPPENTVITDELLKNCMKKREMLLAFGFVFFLFKTSLSC